MLPTNENPSKPDHSVEEDPVALVLDVQSLLGEEVYEDFLSILKERATNKAPIMWVMKRVAKLFQGQGNLLERFNRFLPDGYDVRTVWLAEEVPTALVKSQVPPEEDQHSCSSLRTQPDENQPEGAEVNPSKSPPDMQIPADIQLASQDVLMAVPSDPGTSRARGLSATIGKNQYNCLELPDNLKTRCMRNYGWNTYYTDSALRAYLQFMALKLQFKDWGITHCLAPSIPINFVWHQHILDVKHYAQACQNYFGQVIGRRTTTSGDWDDSERIQQTKEAANALFGNAINEEMWVFAGDKGIEPQKKRYLEDVEGGPDKGKRARTTSVGDDSEDKAEEDNMASCSLSEHVGKSSIKTSETVACSTSHKEKYGTKTNSGSPVSVRYLDTNGGILGTLG